jgi:aryl-alcohol dehydrogenase
MQSQHRRAFDQGTRVKITAAVIESRNGPFHLEEAEIGEPRADELLVKIAAVGMCHSDLSVRSQATPFPLPGVLGHEGAGVIDQVGAKVTGFRVGDKVVLSFDSCGSCPPCQAGNVVYCQHWIPLNLLGGSRLDGSATLTRAGSHLHGHFFGQSSFATHALVSARSAVKVDDDLDPSQLAPLGCSVQTGAGAILNVARPEPGSTIVVFGAGGVGLVAVMAAMLTPAARVIAVDVNAGRLELASKLGATDTVNPADDDPVSALLELTGGLGAKYAVETSGRLPVLNQAISSLSSAGTCVVVGAPPLGSEISVDVPNLLGRGIRLIGTNQGDSNPRQFIPRLIDLYRRGRLPFDRLIRSYPFDQINVAAQDTTEGRSIKPVMILPT